MTYPITKTLINIWTIGFLAILLLALTGCETDYYAKFPNGHGQAKVSISLKPSYLNWSLDIKNLDLITMVHIHCSTGDYVGVTFNTAFNLFTANGPNINGTALTPDKGNFCGWLTMKDVKASLDAGNAYVNIHTYAQPKGATKATLTSLSMLDKERWDRFFERLNDNR